MNEIEWVKLWRAQFIPGETTSDGQYAHMHSRPGGIWFGSHAFCPFCELATLKAKAAYEAVSKEVLAEEKDPEENE